MAADSIFFVPVFNQARELPVVLKEIEEAAPRSGLDFLLVNNGSSDGSEDMVRGSGWPFLEVRVNRGVGYSNILAVDWALKHDYKFFGAMASNGKMLAGEAHRLLAPLRIGNADYVTGSRFLRGGSYPNLPLFRRLAIPAVNQVVRATTGRRLTDATNGFRAFRLEIMRRAEFDWHQPKLYTYGFEYYLYAKVLRDRNLRTLEIPVTMRYPAEGPYSKIRAGKDWVAMLKPWINAARESEGFRPG